MTTPAVADGVLVYWSDPAPTGGELVFDFVAGYVRAALAGLPSVVDATAAVASAAGAADTATTTTSTDIVEAQAVGVGHAPSSAVNATAGQAVGDGVADNVSVPAVTVGFAATQNGTITYATDPAVTGTELAFDFVAGTVGFVAAHDNRALTLATAGSAVVTGAAGASQGSVAASVDTATGAGISDSAGAGFEPVTASATGVAYDIAASSTTDALRAFSIGEANDAQTVLYVNAVEALAVAANNDASVLSAVTEDVDPRTINVRDRGHTVTIYRKR